MNETEHKEPKPEIYKTVVLSTAHVTPEDCKRLDEQTDSWTSGVSRRRYGYRIDLDHGGWRELGPMSILFEDVIAFAVDHGCCILELDPYAQVLPYLRRRMVVSPANSTAKRGISILNK